MAGVPDKFSVRVLDRSLVVYRAIHMAVSGFEDRDGLARLARRRPERIGSHILRLDLRPGLGICCTDATGGPGHWSIWGTPAHLRSCVVDIHRV